MEMDFKSSNLGPRVPLTLTMKSELICAVMYLTSARACQQRENHPVVQERDAVWSLRTGLEGTTVIQAPLSAPCDTRLLNFKLKVVTCVTHAI